MGDDHGTMKRICIFGNGSLHTTFLRELRKGDYVIGVDRAAYWLLKNHVIPNVAIGDFDSATRREFNLIKISIKSIQTYPPEKDSTDMELAMTYADGLHAKSIVIFGATGTRLDHTLSLLHLLGNHIVVDKHNRIRLIGRGKTTIEKASYRYISILPYTNSIRLSLSGFRYNVDRKILKKGTSLGVSNEIVGKSGSIELFSGKAWVIESND